VFGSGIPGRVVRVGVLGGGGGGGVGGGYDDEGHHMPAAYEVAAAEAAAAEYLWAGGRDSCGDWGAVRRHTEVGIGWVRGRWWWWVWGWLR